MTVVDTFRGSVNRWECDENDHLNVRFYLRKAEQGIVLGLSALGLADHRQAASWLKRASTHHIRYLQEARVAAPIVGTLGVTGLSEGRLELLSELSHGFSGEPLATLLSELEVDPAEAERLRAQTPPFVSVPTHAAPRGLPAAPSPYATLGPEAARAHGYRRIGAGVIEADECSPDGACADWALVGRTSDSMPSLWSTTHGTGPTAEFLGGAVLEYRFQRNGPLEVGEPFVHYAALGEIGSKTYRISHLLYRADTGMLVSSAEAVSIAMDLEARRSLPITEEHRQRMMPLQRRPLAGTEE
ncbi:MAG: acyl-ACP thioesterase [Pseudomonadota bacterium]